MPLELLRRVLLNLILLPWVLLPLILLLPVKLSQVLQTVVVLQEILFPTLFRFCGLLFDLLLRVKLPKLQTLFLKFPAYLVQLTLQRSDHVGGIR